VQTDLLAGSVVANDFHSQSLADALLYVATLAPA
jgi:hypothetical protein